MTDFWIKICKSLFCRLCLSFYLLRHDSFEWINRAPMSITPHNCNCVVSFSLHICWIDVFGHFSDLQNLPAIDLINAGCTRALNAEFVRVDRLDNSFGLGAGCVGIFVVKVLLNENLGLDRVISGLQTSWGAIIVQRSDLLVYFLGDLFVDLYDGHFFG